MFWFVPNLLLAAACIAPIPEDQGDTAGSADDTAAFDSADSADSADTGEDSGEPDGPAALEMGEVVDMEQNEDGSVSLAIANEGTYIVILVSTATSQGESYGYADDAAEAATTVPGSPPPSTLPPRAQPPVSTANVGDERTFSVYDGSAYQTITARVSESSAEFVIWEDQTTPNEIGSLDQSTIDTVVANLEGHVLPRERQAFGSESDVDGNGKIDILISYTVNQYGAVAYVTQCDIGTTFGCGDRGNHGEIIYLGVPDPEDSYGTPQGITETVAHELNHLIYGWHKYVVQGQPNAEENIYLTEGMSALAQDLSGYNNGNQYVWAAALEATDYLGRYATVDAVSVNDFLRGTGYYDGQRDGALRGAAYLYLRYLFEQAGGMDVEPDGTLVDQGGMAFLQQWFDVPELGEDTVFATTGREVDDVSMDWFTALVVSGRVENDDPAYNFQPRVVDPVTGYEFGVDMYALIHGWLQLAGPEVQKFDRNDGNIRAGGVEYLQGDFEGGSTIMVPVHSDAVARARLLRIE